MNEGGASQDVDRPGSTPQKKSPLDTLSREDLLKKCKSLLTISQKAKQAKDDAVEEVKQTKHQLNICIQESEKLKSDNEKLKLRVNTIAEEKESVLSAIENVKSNNLELQNLVRSISGERDSFFQDVGRLNTEKQKLIKVVDMIGRENDANMAENRNLKEDKRKLNDELDNTQSEREVIESEIKDIKLKLVYLLNNSFALLKSFDIDVSPVDSSDVDSGKKFTGVICDLIAKLDKNLALTIETVSKPDSEKNAAQTVAIVSKESQTSITKVEEKSTVTEVSTELDTDINELKRTVVELEKVNQELKGKLDVLKTEAEETSTLLIDNGKHAEDLMDELENCRLLSSDKTKEIGHLKDEICALMEKNKKQTFNAMEMKGVKNENEELKAVSAERETEIGLLKKTIEEMEVNNCKLSLHIESLGNVITGKDVEITRMKVEIDDFEKSLSEKIATVEKLDKDIVNIQKVAEDNDNKYKLELEQLREQLSNLGNVLEQKESELASMSDRTIDTETISTKYTSEIATLRSELSGLQKLVEEKENLIALMKREREDIEENNAKRSTDFEEQTVELSSLRQITEETEIKLKTFSSEIHSLKKDISFLQKMVNPETVEEQEEETKSTLDIGTNIAKCFKGIANLKMEITNLHTVLNDKDYEVNTLKEQSKETETKISSEVDSLKNEIWFLQKMVNPESVEETEDVNSTKDECVLKTNMTKCFKGIANLKMEITNLHTVLNDKDDEMNTFKEQSKETETKIYSEVDSLKNEIWFLRKMVNPESVEETEDVNSTKDECVLETNMAKCSKGIAKLKMEITNLHTLLDDKVEEVNSLKEQCKETETRIKKFSTELHSFKNEISFLQKMVNPESTEEPEEDTNSTLDVGTIMAKCSKGIAKLKIEITNLHTVLDDKNEVINSLRDNIKEIESEKQEKHKSDTKLSLGIEGLKNEITCLQKTIEEKDSEIIKLKQDSTENQSQMLKYVSDVEALKTELSSVKNAVKTEELAIEQTKQNNVASELKCEISRLKEVLEGKDEEVATVKLKLAELEDEGIKLHAEIDKLMAEMSKLNDTIDEKESEYKSGIVKFGTEIQVLKNDISNLQKSIEMKEMEVSTMKEGKQQVESEMFRLQKILDERELEILRLSEESNEFRANKLKYSSEIESLSLEVKSLKELIDLKENEMSSHIENARQENTRKELSEVDLLNKRIVDFERTLESKQSELEQINAKYNEEIQSATRSITELQETSDKKTSEIAALKFELQQLSLNIKNMEKEFTEQLRVADERYNSKRDNLTDELVNVQNASAETEATLDQVRYELELLKVVQVDFNAAKRENGELLGEMNEMNQVLKQRGETISKLKELNNELEQKLKAAAEELEAKAAELATLSEVSKEHGKAVEEIATLGKEREKAVEEINRLKSKVQQLYPAASRHCCFIVSRCVFYCRLYR